MHRNNLPLYYKVIIIAILLAIILSGVVGYLYVHSKHTKNSHYLKTSSQTQQQATLLPSPGTIVRPGQAVQIEFFPQGDGLTEVMFFIHHDMKIVPAPGPYVVNITVPDDFTGKLQIRAVAVNSDGTKEGMATDSFLIVKPEGTLKSITLSPNASFL